MECSDIKRIAIVDVIKNTYKIKGIDRIKRDVMNVLVTFQNHRQMHRRKYCATG